MGVRTGLGSIVFPKSAPRGRLRVAPSGALADGVAPGPDSDQGTMVGLGDVALFVCIERRRPAALAEVCRRHGGALHAVTTTVCGSACAEGVVAEVLLELWWQPQRFDPDASSLRAFLLGRAHPRAEAVARSGRDGTTSPPRAAEVSDHDVDGGNPAQVLAVLSEAERAVLVLACLGGYGCGEIAKVLEEPEGVVAAHMRSGLRRLGRQPTSRQARRRWGASTSPFTDAVRRRSSPCAASSTWPRHRACATVS